ncbi:MAG: purine-binding chemotaxis protein CheW [Ignavibacteriae bacterium]|nr:purine-binding chemotaxis protein CheW [Ignavibacteriota bacterium]MCB0748790.1 purine-binding chemotaxis protein CheW [Ignavibacteriota bacterium]
MEKETSTTIMTEELLQLVSFKIGEAEFGVDILHVQEINKMMALTLVPNTAKFIEGVVNLRGRIIPVLNLRKRLGLEVKKYDSDTRIIVVEVDDKTIGFIVDEVKEVLRIPKSITEAPPEIVTGVDSDYITAIGKLEDRLIILLDLTKILSNVEKNSL